MAKKKLNVKFLVIFTSVVGVALVLAVVWGLFFYRQSPERAVRRAEEAQKEGNWEQAATQWGKAARYSNNNPDYSLKAIDATMHLTSGDRGQEMISAIFQSYNGLLANDPGNLGALRGQMRLLYSSGRLDQASADVETREVRRLAGEILKQVPGDAEAKTLRAVATLNLSTFPGEGVTPDQVAAAEADLRQVAAGEGAGGDGLAVLMLTQRSLRDADAARMAGDPAKSLELWQGGLAQVDAAAAKAGEPAAASSTDAVLLRRRIGESYRFLARIKPLFDAAALVKSGTAVTAEQARQLNDDPLTKATQAKAGQFLSDAVAGLDDARDGLDSYYRDTILSDADFLGQTGDPDAADALYRKLLAARPWDAGSALIYSQFLQSRNRVDDAVALLREQRKRAEEPLPDLTGFAGIRASEARLGVGPTLADLLLTQRDRSNDAQQKEALLTEAKGLFDTFDAQRRARGGGDSAVAARIRGQIQLAGGDTVAALQTLNSALRLSEGAKNPADVLERLRSLELVANANELLGQTGAARRALEEMARLRPDLPAIKARLAQSYLNAGDVDQARPLVEAITKADPDNAAYRQLADRLETPEQRAAAYAAMAEATPEQRLAKLQAALNLRKTDEAIRLSQAALADKPDNTNLALLLSTQLRAAGRIDEAAAVLEPLVDTVPQAKILFAQLRGGTKDAINAMPDGANKLLLQAQLATANGDAATALSKLEDAHKLEPANTKITNALFDAYARSNKPDEAAALVDGLKKENGDGMNGRSYDVRLSLLRGNTEQAVRDATALASDYPVLSEALGLAGAALAQANRPAEAVNFFRRGLELAPGNAALLGGMINALQSAGRGQETKQYIDAGLRANPDNPTYQNAATAYELAYGNPDDVIAQRRKAVADKPDDAAAQLMLGRTMLAAAGGERAGKPEGKAYATQAADVFAKGLAQFPNNAGFLQGLVAAATQAGPERAKAAEPTVAAAVTPGEGKLAADPVAAVAAGEFFANRGDLPRSEVLLRQALSAGGDLAADQKLGILTFLSEIIARQGRVDEAVSVLGAYADRPGVLERQVNLLATRVAGNPASAEAYDAFRKLSDGPLAENKLSPGALNAMAFAELQHGDWQRAQTLADKSAAARAGDPRTLFFQAAIESRKPGGSVDRALDLLRQALAVNPKDADVLRETARLQRLRGQTDDAATTLSRLLDDRPGDVPARLELLNLLTAANPPRVAEALRVFREAEAAGVAKEPALLLARARLEISRGRIDDGLDYAKQAADTSDKTPQAAAILNSYLAMLLEQNRLQPVIERTQPLVADQAAPWWVFRARAQALAKANRRDDAVVAYRRALEAAGPSGAGEVVVRDAYATLGFEAAFGLIKKDVDAGDPLALTRAASLYALDGKTREATDALVKVRQKTEQAGTLTPQQAATLDAQLGTLALQAVPPKLDEAETAFRSALAVAPRDMGVLNNLAYTLTQQAGAAAGEAAAAKRAEAVKVGQEAYEVAQTASRDGSAVNPNVLDTYAWALASRAMADGDKEGLGRAVDLLRQARAGAEDADNRFAEVYLHLSQALSAAGQSDAAQEAARGGLAVLEQQRQAKRPVDAGVESALNEALSGKAAGGAEAAAEK